MGVNSLSSVSNIKISAFHPDFDKLKYFAVSKCFIFPSIFSFFHSRIHEVASSHYHHLVQTNHKFSYSMKNLLSFKINCYDNYALYFSSDQ
jgi:hypothetical protein